MRIRLICYENSVFEKSFRCKDLLQLLNPRRARAILVPSAVRILETDMKHLALAALIALGAAAPLPSMAYSNVSVVIRTAPPAPLYERVPPPRYGYVWAPGHWEWNGYRHVWAPGFWLAERPGFVYRAPAWYQGNGGWYLQPAAWTPYAPARYERQYERDGYRDRQYERGYGDRPDYRDRDRDGVPDRYEHGHRRWDEDRDGVPNRYDRDRDGDGVPNRWDRRPDNPYRR